VDKDRASFIALAKHHNEMKDSRMQAKAKAMEIGAAAIVATDDNSGEPFAAAFDEALRKTKDVHVLFGKDGDDRLIRALAVHASATVLRRGVDMDTALEAMIAFVQVASSAARGTGAGRDSDARSLAKVEKDKADAAAKAKAKDKAAQDKADAETKQGQGQDQGRRQGRAGQGRRRGQGQGQGQGQGRRQGRAGQGRRQGQGQDRRRGQAYGQS